MDAEQLTEVVHRLRRIGAEQTDIEVKSAVKEAPKSLRETLSAFRNGSGGLVVLGLDEARGFIPSEGFNATRCRDSVAGFCSDDLEPPLRTSIEIVEFEGGSVVTLEIEEASASEKPVFVRSKGTYGGSFIRGGDGDRRLSEYEVSQLLLNRGQPTFDKEPVAGASMSDLDEEGVDRFLERLRARGGTALSRLNRESTLKAVGVVISENGELIPTLGGLLVLGRYPQQFFPQLNVTLVVLPNTSMGQASDGRRFLDNRTIDGPIPTMVHDVVEVLKRHLSRTSVVSGVGRRDAFEYPLEVVREAVVNALMHRDYSPGSRGSQVQIELYPDRLVLRNSGGLFGGVDTALLGEAGVSSSRNATLARLLSDAPMPGRDEVVCENRGSGIPAMFYYLRTAGMTPPKYESSPSQTTLTIPRHGLLDDNTLTYIANLDGPGLSDAQAIAVAIMRSNGEVSNENLRGWGVDRLDATQALADLVSRGLAYRKGGRRYATYRLVEVTSAPTQLALPGQSDSATFDTITEDILAIVRQSGPIGARDIAEALGLNYQPTLKRINRLIDAGHIEGVGPKNSKLRTYRELRKES